MMNIIYIYILLIKQKNNPNCLDKTEPIIDNCWLFSRRSGFIFRPQDLASYNMRVYIII